MAAKKGRNRGRVMLVQGLLGGARWQLWAGLGLMAFSSARKVVSRVEETVYSEKLRPGERLVITHLFDTRAELKKQGKR